MFEWKHPSYYAELRKKLKEQQASESNQDQESSEDKEPETESNSE